MALADERWFAALAKTAAALLADHRFIQNFWDQRRGRAVANRTGDNRQRRTYIFDRREVERLLARVFRGPDLSLQLRHGDLWADYHARTGVQRVYRRRDFLRRLRLSTATRARALVSRRLDLLRASVSHEKSARSDLSTRDFHFAFNSLSRSAIAFPQTFPLGLHLDLRRAVRAVVRRDRAAFSRIFAATSASRVAGTLAFVLQCSGKR